MVIFCLNGLVYHHINGPFAAWLSADGAPGVVVLTIASLLLSLASIAVTVPLILIFNRWIPQLIGRPKVAVRLA